MTLKNATAPDSLCDPIFFPWLSYCHLNPTAGFKRALNDTVNRGFFPRERSFPAVGYFFLKSRIVIFAHNN